MEILEQERAKDRTTAAHWRANRRITYGKST